ncbi:TetR/AcrR family transcriptional regulator [Nocardioides limicola]|uniref:TetR/AcrR family transcriptional regulator n=1 Tax=Nocardioides limicola TaxID=2803368 RepID=UPI00193C5D16|nr:TetR/AcrR family transcriptional regulator [Nocardioides sp. DJM-14]
MSDTRRGRPPKADRRPQIMAAAQEVLGERGYANTSMKQIAEAAGIAPGLLTYYFPTKQELLLAVVEALEVEIVGRWRNAPITDDSPLGRIDAYFAESIRIWSKQPELFRIFYDLTTLAAVDAELGERLAQMLRRLRDVTAEEFARVSADLPTPPPEGVDLPGSITAGFHGALYEALALGEDPTAALNGLRFMTLSAAAMSYVAAGQLPPISFPLP